MSTVPAAATDAKAAPKLVGAELNAALKKQLEFYFSRQNLATDHYLLGQMNAQKYVPIDVIASFRKIKSLTEDRSLIVKIMKESKTLVIDETGKLVRPNIKTERTTLILRDIASSTPVDDVKKIFTEDKECAAIVSIRAEVGNNWYVTFGSEKECTDTCAHLTFSGKKFNGERIRSRVKAETLNRGFYTPPTHTTTATHKNGAGGGKARFAGQGGYAAYGYTQYGFAPQYANQHYYQAAQAQAAAAGGAPPTANDFAVAAAAHTQQQQQQQQQRQGAGKRSGNKGGAGPAAAATVTAGQTQGGRKGGKKGQGKGQNNQRGGAGQGQGNAKGQNNQRTGGGRAQGKAKQPQLGPADFPALPGAAAAAKADDGAADAAAAAAVAAVPTTGYASSDFTQYTREQLNAIVVALKENKDRPASLPTMASANPILRKIPLSDCQLMEPFPIMYPASPSPMQMPQPGLSGHMPPLDLDTFTSMGGNDHQNNNDRRKRRHSKKRNNSKTGGQGKRGSYSNNKQSNNNNNNKRAPAKKGAKDNGKTPRTAAGIVKAAEAKAAAAAAAANATNKAAHKKADKKTQQPKKNKNNKGNKNTTSTSSAAPKAVTKSPSISPTPTPTSNKPTAADIVKASAHKPLTQAPGLQKAKAKAAQEAAEAKAAADKEKKNKHGNHGNHGKKKKAGISKLSAQKKSDNANNAKPSSSSDNTPASSSSSSSSAPAPSDSSPTPAAVPAAAPAGPSFADILRRGK